MSPLLRPLKWVLKGAVFLALFAFALNNQQDATVHLLFGHAWNAPMTLIVLAAFALGMVVGVLGMLPGWWARHHAPGGRTDTQWTPVQDVAPPHDGT